MTDTDTHPDLEQLVMPELVPPQPDALGTLVALSKRLTELEDLRLAQVEALEKIEKEQKDLSERLIPDLLTATGLTEFRLTSGQVVKLKNDYFGNISVARAEAAFAWLRENNMGGIIKEQITVSPEAKAALEAAEVPYESKLSVPAPTLKAFVKERVESGNEFPRELFGVHVATKAVVK